MFAQEKGEYNGPYKLLNYQGKATYGFELNEQDTILNGGFLMQKSNLENLLTKKDSTFLIEGTFDKGIASGFWKFRFGVFEARAESQVVDYQYRISASGVQEEVQGLMVQGKPDGSWNYTVQRIKDGDIVKTLFKSSITFENGTPQQNFRIENDSAVLVGRFLRNGFAQDEWVRYTIDQVDASERWLFNDGVLEQIVNQVDGKENSIPVFNATIDETKSIALDLKFLSLLDIKLTTAHNQIPESNSIASLLTQNDLFYQKVETILTALGTSGLSPNFGVRVPYYPVDSISKGHLSVIEMNVTAATAVSDAYLDNTLLDILKLSDAEALALHTSLAQMVRELLVPLQKLVAYNQDKIIEFLTKDDILKNLWPNGIDSDILAQRESNAPSTGFKSIKTLAFDFEDDTMASIAMLAQYTAEHLEFVKAKLKVKLSKQEREQERMALDEQLLAQNKRLSILMDSVGNTLPLAYQKALSAIQTVTVKNLGDLSSKEDLELTRQLVVCHENMHQLALSVIALPAQSDEITKLYQDRIWNPFMATLMNEAVKKRITSAYHNVLIPYFLDQVNTKLSCENVDDIKLLLDALHRRMLELINEDTKKLERKLRKETDPLSVLDMLKLKVVENSKEE
ncbi:hypothetical protein ACFQZJ_09940 [Maribacter chungangensis]|uniref:Uncharacterized protein n=1 Tax=Maribacter chungangensis TaxID=1069117 RepID=A0ABW3B4H2_9FLAO